MIQPRSRVIDGTVIGLSGKTIGLEMEDLLMGCLAGFWNPSDVVSLLSENPRRGFLGAATSSFGRNADRCECPRAFMSGSMDTKSPRLVFARFRREGAAHGDSGAGGESSMAGGCVVHWGEENELTGKQPRWNFCLAKSTVKASGSRAAGDRWYLNTAPSVYKRLCYSTHRDPSTCKPHPKRTTTGEHLEVQSLFEGIVAKCNVEQQHSQGIKRKWDADFRRQGPTFESPPDDDKAALMQPYF